MRTPPCSRRPVIRRGLLGLVALWMAVSHALPMRAQTTPHPIADATGGQPNRSYFGELPFEHIDTLTGNLVLTFTDLVLPGYGTMDVAVQRSYNSKRSGTGWTYGFAGWPHRVIVPEGPPAPGPRPPNGPEEPDLSPGYPKFVTSDGAVHRSYAEIQVHWNGPAPRTFSTDRFWRYHVQGRRLELPDGVECFYNARGDLVEVRDPFQNRVTVAWDNGRLIELNQILGDGRTRTITWTPAASFEGAPPGTMVFNGHTVTYQENGPGSMRPPIGPGWQHEYSDGILSAVVTPQGGRVEYTFKDHNFNDPLSNITNLLTRTVETRTTSGPDITPGSWAFGYSTALGETNTVDGPEGVHLVFKYRSGARWHGTSAPREMGRYRPAGSGRFWRLHWPARHALSPRLRAKPGGIDQSDAKRPSILDETRVWGGQWVLRLRGPHTR